MTSEFSAGSRRRDLRRARARIAFSLVEVVLSLGIASFALLVMVALVPVGIQSTKDSLEETGAINLLSSLVSDRKSTPFGTISTVYRLPQLTTGMPFTSNYFGVTAANTNTTVMNQALYRVTYQVTPPQSGSLAPYQVDLKISWPPMAVTTPAGYVEQVVAFPQP